jgi:hypothetical protein
MNVGGNAVEHRIRIGETAKVRPRWWGKSWSVTYAGMPSRDSYSVVVTWTMGHNSAAYNLYLHQDQRQFELPPGMVTVLEQSPEELRLRFVNGDVYQNGVSGTR